MSSKNVVFATEVNASGLASALNTYQEFLKKEYGLEAGRPISYVFKFDDEIGKSKIHEGILLDHTRKNMRKGESKVKVEANPEQATPFDENDMLRSAAATDPAGNITATAQSTAANNQQSKTNTGLKSKTFEVAPGQEINFNQGKIGRAHV